MKLKYLTEVNGNLANTEITGITCDSRQVKPGYLFVCIKGAASDGHEYAAQAVKNGAAAVVVERDTGEKNQILVETPHAAYADICAKWFGNPADSLHLLGVTGTNGKTSVTYMLKCILEKAGYKVGLIGTIQNMIGNEIIAAHNTTPNAYELNSLFALMKAKGCTYVIMEVSSHALDQCRVYRLNFDAAMFTNLTQDHLDYHKTMENYLAAKKKLFKMCKTAVINKDDSYADEIIKDLDCKVVTYSTGDNSTYSAKGINFKPTSVEYEFLSDSIISHIKVNTGGRFTVYNSLCAAVCAVEIGIPITTVAAALAEMNGVKGRAETVPTGRDFHIIIDYAHTPDGLEQVLRALRPSCRGKLIVLFGCGGDRDRTKRPLMGAAACKYADKIIVTSDNPRSEDPIKIIGDILKGTDKKRRDLFVEPDRRKAIALALKTAEPGDTVLLAGKGHEKYQLIGGEKLPLDERETVRKILGLPHDTGRKKQ